jgi:hypothetical protein
MITFVSAPQEAEAAEIPHRDARRTTVRFDYLGIGHFRTPFFTDVDCSARR